MVSTLAAMAITLASNKLKFRYEHFEGTPSIECRHEPLMELPYDWTVVCGDKKYTVHLALTAYPKAVEPKLSYELLYWVTEHKSPTEVVSNGSTTWFHMREKGDLMGVDVRQSVDNDQAGLYLTVSP